MVWGVGSCYWFSHIALLFLLVFTDSKGEELGEQGGSTSRVKKRVVLVGSKTLENPRFQILSFYDVTKLPTTPLSVFCVFNNVTCFWSPMKKSQLWCSMTVTAAAAGILGLHLVVGPARTAGSRVLNSMGLWIRIHIWRIRIQMFFSITNFLWIFSVFTFQISPPGSGFRRENKCGSMRIWIHSAAQQYYYYYMYRYHCKSGSQLKSCKCSIC